MTRCDDTRYVTPIIIVSVGSYACMKLYCSLGNGFVPQLQLLALYRLSIEARVPSSLSKGCRHFEARRPNFCVTSHMAQQTLSADCRLAAILSKLHRRKHDLLCPSRQSTSTLNDGVDPVPEVTVVGRRKGQKEWRVSVAPCVRDTVSH